MIKELTPLRFVLCLMILFHHVFHYAAGGTAAVATFFVLSGFCMTLGYKGRINEIDYFNFVKKRIVRIFPIHWITLCVWLLLALLLKNNFTINIRVLFANFFLLQSWIPLPEVYFSYNEIAWYLSTAMFAYLLFPMIMQQLNRLSKNERIITLFVLLFIYLLIVIVMPTANRHAMLYINPCSRLLDFIFGMFLANWYMSKKWNIDKRYQVLIDIGILLAFLGLNVVGILASENMRLIAAIYWLPSVALILLICIASKISTFLSKMMISPIVQKCTQCAFSLMMWSIIFEQNVKFMPMPIWLGIIVLYLVAQCSYYLIECKLTNLIGRVIK